MLRFGWKAGPEQFSPQDLLEQAIVAEQAGFDFLEASDHFHPWDDAGQACFVWTWLGAVAARTSRILLGTGVTCPILRYHPAVVAQATATLAVMAPDRAFLGLGTGEALNEFAVTGSWPEFEERQARLAEAIEVMRALWSGDRVTHKGTYYTTRGAKVYTRPTASPPVYISSLVPESAAFAGQHGDGLITVGGKDPEMYQQMLQRFEAGARQAGKDPGRMPRMVELLVAYTTDREGAIRDLRQYWAGSLVPALYTQRIYTPALSAENGKVVGADTISRMMVIGDSPDQILQSIARYVDLGFDQLVFHSPSRDQRTFLERFGTDVLPRLRQLGARGGEATLAGAGRR